MVSKRSREEPQDDSDAASAPRTPRKASPSETRASKRRKAGEWQRSEHVPSQARHVEASNDEEDRVKRDNVQDQDQDEDEDEDELAASTVTRATQRTSPPESLDTGTRRSARRRSPAKKLRTDGGTDSRRQTPSDTPTKQKRTQVPPASASDRARNVNDTPSKSSARRRRNDGSTRRLHAPDDEADAAASLILRVAAEDASDANDNDSAASSDNERGNENDEQEDDDEEEEARTRRATVATQGGFEAYFEQASRRVKTSDNTLAKLPALPHDEYLGILRRYEPPYAAAVEELCRSHVALFPEWSFELDQDYALCLYGFGSKRRVIMEFCGREQDLFGDPYVVINGYHPNIDLRQICQSITTGLGATGGDVETVLSALDHMSYERLVLAFHNIDGPNLRNDKAQAQIARIVQHPNVRLVCSIDHINAPLLWPTSRLAAMHLIFHDATTFVPYTLETELQADTLTNERKVRLVGDRGVKWVLQTLSQNAQRIFRLLLAEQMRTGQGTDSVRLYDLASKEFAVSSHTAFEAQLGEFLDHEIIVTERDTSVGETLRIPFEKAELQRLLEDIDGGDEDE